MRTTTSDLATSRIAHLVGGDRPAVALHVADLGDAFNLLRVVESVGPDEVYNLAAQSHVRESFDQPVNTGEVTALGAVRLLEAVRLVDSNIRFYQASSSEMFGSSAPPQNESTPFHPRSPYAVAKVHAYWATINYRESYGMHACNGILFNHESPRRGKEFVTRKITSHLARIMIGEVAELRLGNLDARRDWGHARDYVEGMHMLVRHEEPLDLVFGTGQSHSIRDFLDAAFGYVNLDWKKYVVIDPQFYRPAEVNYLESDPSQARSILGWHPRTSFRELVEEMVRADCSAVGINL